MRVTLRMIDRRLTAEQTHRLAMDRIGHGTLREPTATRDPCGEQTVMYGWPMNRLVPNPRVRVTAEYAWEFCLHGLRPLTRTRTRRSMVWSPDTVIDWWGSPAVG